MFTVQVHFICLLFLFVGFYEFMTQNNNEKNTVILMGCTLIRSSLFFSIKTSVTKSAEFSLNLPCFKQFKQDPYSRTSYGILYMLRIGRDRHLDQSEAYDIIVTCTRISDQDAIVYI